MAQSSATAQVIISEPAPYSGRVLIRADALGTLQAQQIAVEVYPADVDTVKATVGNLTSRGKRVKEVRHEGVAFSSSATANTRLPIAGDFGYEVVYLALSPALSVSENPPALSDIRFAHDALRGDVFAYDDDSGNRVAVIAAISCSYTTGFKGFYYSPATEIQVVGGLNVPTAQFGSIVAIKGQTVETLSMSRTTSEGEDAQREAWRVTSEYVIDPDGRWEKPENFPDENWGDGPSTSTYLINERVHELGYATRNGAVYYETFDHPREQGPDASFRPVYSFSRSSAPGQEYLSAWSNIPWDKVEAGAESRWSGLVA